MVSVRCPICRKPAPWEDNPNRPFCSERCRLIDLGNWAGEKYSLPAAESAQESDEEEEDKPEQDSSAKT
jgi:uncharacterized protein